MIRAMVFDMDGVLVQNEKLKALSVAMAVQRLRGLPEPDPAGIEAYRDMVGASREVVSRHIVDKLGLDADLRPLMAKYGASETWEVLGAMRRAIYDEMVADPQVVRDNQWPHTVDLLRVAKKNLCRTGLATLSARDEALHFVRALGLEEVLDVVLAREDVKRGKPDPEIYLLAAERLEVQPQECVVIEDSPNGVRAGLAAGMNVVAFGTPFTIDSLHSAGLVEDRWIVHDPDKLADVVQRRIDEHSRTAHQQESADLPKGGVPS